MRMVLDACVIYPTVMREMLLGVARTGAYTPLWSARILEEWALAARKLGPEGEIQARGEIAMAQTAFPRASIAPHVGLEARLWLPDANDIHVLATAVHGNGDGIITMNAKDFPRGLLAEEGLSRNDPDAFLLGHLHAEPEAVEAIANAVLGQARNISGQDWTLRALLKKARLPRLGKALTT